MWRKILNCLGVMALCAPHVGMYPSGSATAPVTTFVLSRYSTDVLYPEAKNARGSHEYIE